MSDTSRLLETSAGDFPLHDYRLKQGGREWTILHTGAVLTDADETHVIVLKTNRLPYGVSLWPSSIALAHEIATRPGDFSGRGVLELGSGTGLPGIVAGSLGGRVVQSDKEELVIHLCRMNGERNQARGIEYRVADWTAWEDAGRYDWILGADILYGDVLHPNLRRIFESNLAPGGRILLSDPFRAVGLRFLESLEAAGWVVTMSKWDVGEGPTTKSIGVFELVPPNSGV